MTPQQIETAEVIQVAADGTATRTVTDAEGAWGVFAFAAPIPGPCAYRLPARPDSIIATLAYRRTKRSR